MRDLTGSIGRLVGLAWLGAAFACGPSAPIDPRPNVLLITVDTLRADHLGSYGFELATSPNIDALAAESVVFERAIAASSSTAPSHASIMTGLYPRQHSIGYMNGPTRLEGAGTLAASFRDAGYATAAFVGNSVLSRRIGLDRGFLEYDDDLPEAEGNRAAFYERSAEQTTERALSWIGQTGEQPFFVWVHYQDPHGPYAPPAAFVGRFQLPRRPDERALPILAGNSGRSGVPAYQVLDGLSLPSEYQSRYADEIFYADRSIGKLLDRVDSHASGRHSIVLFTSDHGESLGEGDRFFVHGISTTPELAHVPLILRAPGFTPARRREVVSHVDVMPTLLELAGLEPPTSSGVALGVVLRGEREASERFVYCDLGEELSAYRSDGFVRLLGIERAWLAGDGSGSAVRDPLWVWHQWNADGSWARPLQKGELEPSIHAYARSAIPMRPLIELSPEYRQQLRALGYAID